MLYLSLRSGTAYAQLVRHNKKEMQVCNKHDARCEKKKIIYEIKNQVIV